MEPVRISSAEEHAIRIVRAMIENPTNRTAAWESVADLLWAIHREQKGVTARSLKALTTLLEPKRPE